MDNLLLEEAAKIEEVRRAAAWHQEKQACILTGLSGSSKPVFFAALDKVLQKKGSMAFITASREEIRAYRRELNYFYPDLPMQELYPLNLPRVQVDARSLELEAGRAAASCFLQGEERGIVFITAEALRQKQLRPAGISARQLELRVGEEREQGEVVAALLALGYERTDQVDALGQFALRGDILDIFPINAGTPVRVEWFDRELDAIRSFDASSQRSLQNLSELKIFPLHAEEQAAWDASIFDYCAPDTLLVLDEPARTLEMLAKLEKENRALAAEVFSKEEVLEQCVSRGVQFVSALGHSYAQGLPSLNIPVRSLPPYNKNINLFLEDLKNYLADGVMPIVMLSGSVKARAFAENLHNYGVRGVYAQDALQAGAVNVLAGDLDHGFRFWDTQWLLLTESDLYGMQKRKRLRSKNQGQQIQYFSDIKAGDYVVHRVQGIGRYVGVENVEIGGIHRDYLLIAYAGDDKLYVPVDQVGMLHKYVGGEGSVPRLSKMGSTDWKRTVSKASKAITELAEELLRLYAQRQIVAGHAFGADTELQKEFEAAFPYEETPDQLKAIAEIKADMEKPQPMERLLCGDVGYGKTEVAVRAAFKAVLDAKQVAILVPTTVLAQQHYLTIKERMRRFGVNVAMLNRFCTPKEQKQILKDLAAGLVDVVIGTHRLLQPDVQFADLGLLVIDEEQRFGVAQKEKIKKWRTGIDVLALSATPIPRTLHLALVNGRDMSVIESPPEDRLPVETYVSEYSDGMIKEAIDRELRRGGRIYYIHNRVHALETIAARLRRLVPGLSIKIAHGQMPENLLEDAMISFYEGDCDLLLCTTIVENGLDVPLANTIIIEGAENFGLSQLYQMRGRVGRSSRLAYAYFLYRPDKSLSEIAEKRLQAIRDFTELGAGFQIAMRDLEIRGAGNLLGSEQSGHIAGIGFGAYCEILERTIRQLKEGKSPAYEPEPVLEIPLDAYIPDNYIHDPRYKMEIYRRLADMEYREREDFLDELVDRFGNPPQEVVMLWRLASIKGLCRLMRVRGINVRPGSIRITFAGQANVDTETFMKLVTENARCMSVAYSKEPQLLYRKNFSDGEALAWLERTLPLLALGNKFNRKL